MRQYDSPDVTVVAQKELELGLKTAERYSNNYYSWSHRQWVLQHFNLPEVSIVGDSVISK